MKVIATAVIKKDNKWYQGFLNQHSFQINKDINKLSDVKKVSEYRTLYTYIKEKGGDASMGEEIMKSIGCDSCYVLDKPIDLTEGQFDLYHWADLFPMCKECINTCKQSHKVKELICNKFTRKK